MSDARQHVFVSLPNQGMVRIEIACWLMSFSHDTRYRLTVTFPQDVPYENGLHHSALRFLASTATHWLNIDADNPPTTSPLDYVANDLDYVGFPTPIHKRSNGGKAVLVWNVQHQHGGFTSYRHSGLEDVRAVGTGCFLVAKRVIQALEAPFARVTDANGCVTEGNDLAFCRRAREAGFTIWAAWDNMCSHFRPMDLSMLMPEPEEESANEPQHAEACA